MKSNEFKDWQFSVYYHETKGIANCVPSKTVTLKDLFTIYESSYLKNKSKELALANEEEKKAIKNMLPYFTASGVYSYRNNASIIEYNSDCLLLDIDELTEEQAQQVQFTLRLQRGCVMSIISPRLKGVKALFRLGGAIEINNYRATLEANVERIAKELKIPEYTQNIDVNQFNQCQACFIGYNETRFFNLYAEPTIWLIENLEKKIVERPPLVTHTHTATNTEQKRIEAYVSKYCTRTERLFTNLKQGERHANIWRVEGLASCIHYAPQLKSEIIERLLTAIIWMYKDEQEAINERAVKTFYHHWNKAQPTTNTVLEQIIEDEKNKCSINLNSLEQ